MTRSITIISLITSLFLFTLRLPWVALIPLLISMYLIFTNGDLDSAKKNSWQFSRYHILFGLWCAISIGLSLLLHVFGFSLLIILCALVGIHMLVIRGALLGRFVDEYIMFHIGYYFVSFVLLWYIPVTYGLQNGILAWLLFPVVTFLLYAGGTFFIELFVGLPLTRHYRTAVFFLISFLSSIILYFFSVPLIGWTSALILYLGIIWFLVHQVQSYISHEKRKNIYAEDILDGKKVIQPAEGVWHSTQATITRLIQKLTPSLRLSVVRCSAILLVGSIISAFLPNTISTELSLLLLIIAFIAYYYANTGWYALKYPTSGADALTGVFMHSIFAWILYTSTGSFYSTSFIFIGMGWSIVHHGISIFLAKQSHYWHNTRKNPLLYGYSISTVAACIGITFLFSYLPLENIFIWAVGLLYMGTIGTMVYFFSRSMLPPTLKKKSFDSIDFDSTEA